jgi:hypothetical protein
MKSKQFLVNYSLKWVIIVSSFLTIGIHANPDAKRLYDDLLSNYNRLIRPVSNNTGEFKIISVPKLIES